MELKWAGRKKKGKKVLKHGGEESHVNHLEKAKCHVFPKTPKKVRGEKNFDGEQGELEMHDRRTCVT